MAGEKIWRLIDVGAEGIVSASPYIIDMVKQDVYRGHVILRMVPAPLASIGIGIDREGSSYAYR